MALYVSFVVIFMVTLAYFSFVIEITAVYICVPAHKIWRERSGRSPIVPASLKTHERSIVPASRLAQITSFFYLRSSQNYGGGGGGGAHLRDVHFENTRFFLYKQPVYKQPGLRFFENNNRIQWSIVMLNNGEQ